MDAGAVTAAVLPRTSRTVAAARSTTWIAVPLGVFMAYNVARLPDVVPELAVPRLPLILGIILLVGTASRLSAGGWLRLWRESTIFRAMLGILALAVITMPIGIWAFGSWTYLKDKYIIQWIMFLVGAVWFADRRVLRRSLAIYLIGVAITAYVSASGNATVQKDVGRVYVSSSLDPNDFGAILVTSIPMAIWLARTASPLGKLLWWSATILMVAGIAPTASRGALLGLLGVAFVLIMVGTTGFRRVLMGGGIALGFVVFSAVVTDEQLARFGAIGGEEDYNTSSGEGRIAIWKRGVWWTIKRPTGYGMDNFPVYFGWLNDNDRAAHNSLVQIGMELGVAGLILFLLVYYTGLRDSARYLANLRGRGPPSHRVAQEGNLARLVIAALVGTFITGFFLSNAYAPITMLMFAIVAGLQRGRIDQGAAGLALATPGPVPLRPQTSRTGTRGGLYRAPSLGRSI